MEDAPIFGWASDPEAGKLVEQYRGANAPIKESDPRIDILIDVGVALGQSNQVYYEIDKILITRAISRDYIQYSILVDDGLVFEVLYTEADMELGEFLPGPWVYRLATLVKGLRRGHRQLIAGAV